MKLDVNCMRYLSKDDYRVLTAIEMTMRNHEMASIELITSVAKLRFGGIHRILSTLLRYKLVAHTNNEYDGYRLSYLGYDILALRTFLARQIIHSVGNQIGVGKESDIFEAMNEDGQEMVIKIHRLGRTSFRSVRKNRDYMDGKSKASWLYMSRLAATKEFAFMKALHAYGYPTPVPIDQNRHIVVMSKVNGCPMSQLKAGRMDKAETIFNTCMEVLTRLAQHGLIHCDFNEFNLMLDATGKVTLIDFPQMVWTSHPNATELFDRDVNCLIKFFAMKMKYIPPEESRIHLHDIIASDTIHIDEEIKASGYTKEEYNNMSKFILDQCDEAEPDQRVESNDNEKEFEDAMVNPDDIQIEMESEVNLSIPASPFIAISDHEKVVTDMNPTESSAISQTNEDDHDETEDMVDDTNEYIQSKISQAKENLVKKTWMKSKGGNQTTRNFTKKRNKYGKVVKNEKLDTSSTFY